MSSSTPYTALDIPQRAKRVGSFTAVAGGVVALVLLLLGYREESPMRLAAADVQWDTSTSATINEDEILSLPNATTAPCWRQFSGYLTASATKQLFYWYHESVEDPASIRCRHRLATAAALSYEKAPLLLARRCRSRLPSA